MSASPLRGLTTRGRCLIAAGLAAGACAVVLDERDLLRVGALLVALPLLSVLLLGGFPIRLTTLRDVEPAELSVGRRALVTLTLRSDSRLLVAGLLLTDEVPPALGEEPRYAVGALSPGATASVRYPLAPRVRGRHQLGPVTVRLADPLGLVEVSRMVAGSSSVLVRPTVLELHGLLGAVHTSAAAGGDGGGFGGGDQSVQDSLVRPYRDGDDLRTVHWRSTARRGELMVRPQEHTRRTGTVVLLDVRPGAHRGSGPTASLERAITLAASTAEHLRAQGIPVRLVTSDGVDLGHGAQALDQLAVLGEGEQRNLVGATELVGPDTLLAVLGRVDATAAEQLSTVRGGSVAAAEGDRAVLLGAAAPGAEILRAAGWGVLEPAEHLPLPVVWQQLCAAQPAGALR